ncbi:hypothetical protein NE237_014493 [Protea cynaroides]|uniref:Uncharacterized protein n=1 Tax=Protea cynaroides TaxID=273540 RepID=A0A9Q0KC75_9MAGN|nr:hypothetical protein NE237_014493 [Protea cynaroides]
MCCLAVVRMQRFKRKTQSRKQRADWKHNISRMEEQGEEEWMVQESPSQGSTMRLILNKGWCLGKKIAITGVAISSAPFVLPPLVVFSTLGVAFAVPFGFVFASYACTEKIMSKFFPIPVSPPILEWNEEEEFLMEYVKQGLETSIEIGDKNSKQDEAENVTEEENGGQQGDLRRDKEKPIKKNLEEKPLRNTSMVIEENRDGENVKNASEAKEKPVKEIEGATVGDSRVHEEEKLITEAKRVVEVGRNGDIVDIAIEEEEKTLQHSQNLDKIGTEGKQKRVIMSMFKKKTAEKRDEKHAKKLVEESKGKRAQDRGQENVYKSKEHEVKPIQEREKMAEERRVEEDTHKIAAVDKPTEVENLKEIADQSGLYMFDDKDAFHGKMLPGSVTANVSSMHTYGIEEDSSIKKDIESESCVVNPVSSSDTAEFNSAKGAYRKETMIPSGKVLLGEEKIWEQIDAMRTIVGYKATRHATCMEELEALYLFAGVEPPASFRDSSDLVEVNGKLRFLMSIVGIK